MEQTLRAGEGVRLIDGERIVHAGILMSEHNAGQTRPAAARGIDPGFHKHRTAYPSTAAACQVNTAMALAGETDKLDPEVKALADELQLAADAHHDAVEAGETGDDGWPVWYATYMLIARRHAERKASRAE